MPVQLVELFNEAYTSGNDIISDGDVEPGNDVSTVRVFCAFDASGTLTAELDQDGTDQSPTLNEGNALVADSLYGFDVGLGDATDINFRYSVDATILYFHVQEVE